MIPLLSIYDTLNFSVQLSLGTNFGGARRNESSFSGIIPAELKDTVEKEISKYVLPNVYRHPVFLEDDYAMTTFADYSILVDIGVQQCEVNMPKMKKDLPVYIGNSRIADFVYRDILGHNYPKGNYIIDYYTLKINDQEIVTKVMYKSVLGRRNKDMISEITDKYVAIPDEINKPTQRSN